MPRRCCEFVDSRLRRSPPDRASAVPYGQAGENAMRFPHLAHRSAAAHKLHSTPQQDRLNLISGKGEPAAGYLPLAYSSPEPVQTPGTVAVPRFVLAKLAIRCRLVDRFVGFRVPSRVSGQRFSTHDTFLPSVGSRRARFPVFIGTMKALRLPARANLVPYGFSCRPHAPLLYSCSPKRS